MHKIGNSKPFHTFTCFGILLLLLASCIGKNDVVLKLKNPKKKETFTSKPVTVSNIQVVNHQIIITGTNLASVSQFQIKDGGANTNLQIESKNETTIVANTISNVTFAAGKILDFIFTNAEAAATFTVNFSLCDSSLGGKGFNCTLTPNDKEVLSYDAVSGKWQPRAVNGLSYIGTFDASGGGNPSAKPAGQYYIVSVAGDIDAGATILGVGDWIVSDGTTWQKIDNSTVITSVHGRTGAVVGAEGDYGLTQLSDATITAPINNQILKYNGTTWVNSDLSALGGGTVTSVSATAPISVTNGTSTPAISISQATTTTNGYLSSADWNTFNNKQVSIVAGTTAQYYRGDKSWQTLDTSVVPENTNLYFTNARALGVPLTGFSANNAAIVATDTILQAFGKAQGQIDNLTSGGSNYIVKNGNDTVTGVVNFNTIGALSIGYTPTNMTDATSKSYVDTQRDSRVAKAGDTMTGDLQLNTNLKFKDSGSNTATLQAPTTITSSYVLKLPPALGTNNQVLTTDAAGNLTWTTPATSAAPNGSAGGELAGTYPNPTIAANAITDSHIAANAISQSKINGLTTALSGKEPTITAGTTAQYLRGDKSLGTFESDVLATLLSGLSTATNAVIAATDSVLVAFGKLQAQITGHATDLTNKADRTNVTQTITALAVTGLSAPSAGADATNKTYVDAQIAGAANQWTESSGNVYRSSGSVGVGTTSPLTKLQVGPTSDATLSSEGISISGDDNQYLFQGINAATNPDSLSYYVKDLAGPILIGNNRNNLQFAAGGTTTQMSLTSTGSVGIGTTTPQTKLDVNGSIRVANDGVACSATTIGTIRTNSTTSLLESCDGTSWLSLNSDSAIPPSSVVLMNSCPAGWTDNGTIGGGPGNAHCGGVSCHFCQSPNSYQAVPASSIFLMESCPAKWTSMGTAIGAASASMANIMLTSCQSPAQASALPQNSRVLMDTCPSSWNDLGQTNGGPGSANCPGGLCHVCQTPGSLMGRSLLGDSGGTNLNGGSIVLKGGSGGSTAGIGGGVNIYGGTPFDGAGGSIWIMAGSGVTSTATAQNGGSLSLSAGNGASNGNGADIVLSSGTGNGTGTNGKILLNSGVAGNVGIGTATPSEKLEVNGRIAVGPNTQWGEKFNVGIDTELIIPGTVSATVGSTDGNLHLESKNGKDIYLNYYNIGSGNIYMATGNNNGSVGIGTTAPGYKLDVQGGDINASGSVRAAGVALTSDRRWKRNITPLKNSIEKIKQLNGVSYDWAIDDYPEKQFSNKRQVGVIAQDVQAVFPELVSPDKEGFLSVNYPALVAPLIEAFKAQQQQIVANVRMFKTMQGEIEEIKLHVADNSREIASLRTRADKAEAENNKLKKENAAIKARLDRIEKMISQKRI